MTETHHFDESGPGPPRGQQAEGITQTVIMMAIGGAAGAASFTHVHDVAAAHGQPGWLAWADAVVLELTSIAAGLELRRRKRIGKPPWFPAAMLSGSVALSLGAQVVEAEPSIIGWLAAALPAVGFLAMVKIAMGRADPDPLLPVPAPAATIAAQPIPVPAQQGTVADQEGMVPVREVVVADQPDSLIEEPGQSGTVQAASGPGPHITALVPAARNAADALAGQGIALSRSSLAGQLRADGHSLSNATASALVTLLRTSQSASPATQTEA